MIGGGGGSSVRIGGRREAVVVIGRDKRWLRRRKRREVTLRQRRWDLYHPGMRRCRAVRSSSAAGHGWPRDRALSFLAWRICERFWTIWTVWGKPKRMRAEVKGGRRVLWGRKGIWGLGREGFGRKWEQKTREGGNFSFRIDVEGSTAENRNLYFSTFALYILCYYILTTSNFCSHVFNPL